MPKKDSENSPEPSLVDRIEDLPSNVNIAALISQYTERPDLFLETMEKHDPGFIKRLNKTTADHSQKLEDSQFNFGRAQAYSSLVIQVVAALAMLGIFYKAVSDSAGFIPLIAIIVFFAISQSGIDTFVEIGKGIGRMIERFKGK